MTTSESTGCRGCVAVIDWSFSDRTLTLEVVPYEGQARPYDPIETLLTNGTYQLTE